MLFALPTGTAQAGWAEYDEARKRGDHTARIAELRSLARTGDPEAQSLLCMEYVRGAHIPEDAVAGAKLCRKGAAQGNALSQHLFGLLYLYGEGVQQDYSEAARWLHLAAEQGHVESLAELGRLYRNGEGVKKDGAKAVDFFGRAAEAGSADAQFELAMMHHYGEGVPKDRSKALAWYRKSANNGNPDAQYMLALHHAVGMTTPQDLAKALQWFHRAAENGHGLAQYKVGNVYVKGVIVPKNITEAVRWLRMAALQGVLDAQLELASIYLGERGIPPNLPESARLFQAAAVQGDAYAQFQIGIMNYNGAGVPRSHEKAANWYGKAAAQGHKQAQLHLAFLYQTGRGVQKNDDKAFKLYRQAAEQGLADSQYALGNAYVRGWGTLKSPDKAVEWFRRAAKQEHSGAMYEIGYAHLRGEGAPRSYQIAMDWFTRSATMGTAAAQRSLGVMYAIELGVDRNRVAAYMLLTLAIDNEIPDEKAFAVREDVAKWMTDAEIGKARRLARNWKPGKELHLPALPTKAAGSADGMRKIQNSLARLGYDAGPADGIMGRKTRAAIRAFEADQELPATGAATTALERALKAAVSRDGDQRRALPTSPDNPALKFASSGTGFAITKEGHVLTNYHVIDDCGEIWITSKGRAEALAADAEDDLALLRTDGRFEKQAAFRKEGRAPLGADIVVTGYPLQSILSTDLGVTSGIVSALKGIRDDPRHLQLTAPAQAGNSGGPVLDRSGNVVGLMVSKLNAMLIAQVARDLPQNINFAITASTARKFLDHYDVLYSVVRSKKTRSVAEIAAMARKFTVRIECWK